MKLSQTYANCFEDAHSDNHIIENKSTIKIDNKNYSIMGESLQGNRRIYVFKCNRMT